LRPERVNDLSFVLILRSSGGLPCAMDCVSNVAVLFAFALVESASGSMIMLMFMLIRMPTSTAGATALRPTPSTLDVVVEAVIVSTSALAVEESPAL
jgi:hypothetical protein